MNFYDYWSGTNSDIAMSQGFLTPTDRERIAEGKPLQDDDELRDRLRHTLMDFNVFWRACPNETLEAVFDPSPAHQIGVVRSATESALALLYLGTCLGDDDPAMRLHEAIRRAEFSRDNRAGVMVDILREELWVTDELLARLDDCEVTYIELEWLMRQAEVDPRRVAECLTGREADEDAITECAYDIEQLREEYPDGFRPTLPTITDVTVVAEDDDKPEGRK